jgi:hypothetical protein
VTAFNVWQPQGNVVANPGGNKIGNPSVIYDTNPVVLLGHTNVFKMWAGLDTNGKIYYFESLDGLTSWTAYSGNPITPGASAAYFPTVYKEGSTYYLYGSATSFPGNGITVFTSTDGVTFTSQGVQIALGGVGAWDHTGAFQLNVLTQLAGTWYAYYSGYNGVTYAQGLVTSTDLIHWTKSASNPIFPGFIGNICFLTVGDTYYAYAEFVPANLPPALLTSQNIPLGRWSASSPSGPWTPLESNGNQVPTYYIASAAEFVAGGSSGLPTCQPNDPRMVVANGNIYLYYTFTTQGGIEQSINAALASGVTPAQLVATYEGVVNVPFTGLTALNLATLGSDPGTGADANPIGGNWSPQLAGDVAQRLSNIIRVGSISTQADSYWNAVSWAADQWSRITVNNEANGSFLGAAARTNTSGVATSYRLVLFGGTGAGAGLAIQSWVSAVATNLLVLAFTISPNDTLMAVLIGTSYLVYWNDYLIANVSTSSIASGAAGFELAAASSVTNAGISAWSGGSLQAAPAITFSISGHAAAGALISYSGTASGSVTADGSGNYAISGLTPGTYTITPSLTGFTFSPASATEIYAGSDVTGVNFTAVSKGYAMLPIPTLLQPGQNGYFFGSYNANKPNPSFEVTATSGNGTTATINVVLREGFAPAVNDLITVTGTQQASGGFNLSNVALSAVSVDPVTGIGTLSYPCTASASSAPDFGLADVLNGEAAATLVNGASKSVAVQTAAGQNDNGKNIAWAISFPTAPAAVTASLQGALFDKDSEYDTLTSTNSLTGDNQVISNVTQRFYRVLISGLVGSGTVISKITI